MNQSATASARSIGFGLLLLLGSNIAVAETVVVLPDDFDGWFKPPGSTGTVSLSPTSPAGNPAGPGALTLVLDGSVAGQVANAARIPIPILRLDEITALGWSASSTTTELPKLKLEYYELNGRAGTLIPLTPAYPGDASWVTFDGLALQWVTTEDDQVVTQSFAAWQAELGSIAVNFMSVGVGSTGAVVPPPTTTYADLVTVNDTIWDFGGSASLPTNTVPEVPALSAWGLMMLAMMIAGAAFVALRQR